MSTLLNRCMHDELNASVEKKNQIGRFLLSVARSRLKRSAFSPALHGSIASIGTDSCTLPVYVLYSQGQPLEHDESSKRFSTVQGPANRICRIVSSSRRTIFRPKNDCSWMPCHMIHLISTESSIFYVETGCLRFRAVNGF